MTETLPAEAQPDAGGFAPETWTFAGHAPGAKSAKVSVWYDADRRRMAFTAEGTGSLAVGWTYQLPVKRYPDSDAVTARLSQAKLVRQHPDREWRAQVEAEALAGDRELAREAMARRAKREPGVLDQAIDPIERLAAGMSYAQREAFLSLITRRVMHAGEAERREQSARTLAAARAATRAAERDAGKLAGKVTKLTADLALARAAQHPDGES